MQREAGRPFFEDFRLDLPAGVRVLNEKRLITWESLFCHYYARLEVDDSTAFDELCSRLGVRKSESGRSLPFPAPNGVDWWIKMPHAEAEKNPNRFLWEGDNNEMININVIGKTAYLMKIGQSVRR
jgi:hypothetical protein